MSRILILALSALLVMVTTEAAAREWRGCTGRIAVVTPGGASALVWIFEGRGSCRSTAYANDCRRAARGAIEYCLNEAWRTRWERRLPGACFPISGSNRPFVDKIGNTNFGRGPGAEGDQDFKWAVERAACCGRLFSFSDTATFAVRGSSDGDSRCQGSWTLEANYVANCRRFRNRGYCG